MAKSFSAQVSDLVAKYEKRMNATFKGSVQDLVEDVTTPTAQGGNMRVWSGFLRSSLMASTSSMPLIDRDARPPSDAAPNSYQPDDNAIEAVILGARIGETLFLGFVASYAGYREALDHFVLSAAQKWPVIVRKNAARAVAAFR